MNLKTSSMVMYEFDQETGNIGTDEEQIIIGFSTQRKQGTLMYITDGAAENQEYISISINNNGR